VNCPLHSLCSLSIFLFLFLLIFPWADLHEFVASNHLLCPCG
jgi:hypothetical protein